MNQHLTQAPRISSLYPSGTAHLKKNHAPIDKLYLKKKMINCFILFNIKFPVTYVDKHTPKRDPYSFQ